MNAEKCTNCRCATDQRFRVDLAKTYHITLGTDTPSRMMKLRLLLFNSEIHCVACYRLGQAARRIRAKNRVTGTLTLLVQKVWNRWVTHSDHCDISSGADIGPGLLLMHRHGVMIGPSEVGANCVIHQNVTIGQRVADGNLTVPRIGRNVWIGPGAIITGGIEIGDGSTISAGTVISKSVPPGSLVGGNPGRVLVQGYDNQKLVNFDLRECESEPPALISKLGSPTSDSEARD